MRCFLAVLLASAVLAWGGLPRVLGCATVTRKQEKVAIATETALIVWDAKTKTQHFIRRASFATRAPYFGFLVPTPGQPTLDEVEDELFTQLHDWTKPRTVTRRQYEWPDIPLGGIPKSRSLRKSVEVLEQGQVAGLKYSILKATDSQALGKWLQEHHYEWTEELAKWLEPYLQAHWHVTAFQNVKPEEAAPNLSMKAVRMSFSTKRPFYPYREPIAEKPTRKAGNRLLRIFLVANERMAGQLDNQARWKGEVKWANPLSDEQRQQITTRLSGSGVTLSESAWLTVLEDRYVIREDSDLHFVPSQDQSTLERPPIIHTKKVPISCGMICVGALGVFLVVAFVVSWVFCSFHRRSQPKQP